jgi:hypothetical protein
METALLSSASHLLLIESGNFGQPFVLLATLFHSGFVLDIFFDPVDGGDIFQKRWLISNGLHGIIHHCIMTLSTT